MPESNKPHLAILDYGLGNLFSVKQACNYAGIRAIISSEWREIETADAILMPGVGAFGDAMETIRRLELIDTIQEFAESGKPVFGICLGMQLLMKESNEFGTHAGLGLLDGVVTQFEDITPVGRRPLKVPHLGWNRVYQPETFPEDGWGNSLLAGIPDNSLMYFVHSYFVSSNNHADILGLSRYGNQEFCSAMERGNIYATQFHPERSGALGLKIYENIATIVNG